MTIIQNRTLNPLALAVLALLHERPMHPYEMQQVISDRRIHQFVKVRAGSLYHTVERLHQRLGLIRPVETARAGRRPERTVYAVTDDGRQECRNGVRHLLRHPVDEYPAFGAAVEMLRMLPPDEALTLLARRIVDLEACLAGLDQALASLRDCRKRIDIIEAEYARAMRAAELEWIKNLVTDLRSGVLTWQPQRRENARDGTAQPGCGNATSRAHHRPWASGGCGDALLALPAEVAAQIARIAARAFHEGFTSAMPARATRPGRRAGP